MAARPRMGPARVCQDAVALRRSCADGSCWILTCDGHSCVEELRAAALRRTGGGWCRLLVCLVFHNKHTCRRLVRETLDRVVGERIAGQDVIIRSTGEEGGSMTSRRVRRQDCSRSEEEWKQSRATRPCSSNCAPTNFRPLPTGYVTAPTQSAHAIHGASIPSRSLIEAHGACEDSLSIVRRDGERDMCTSCVWCVLLSTIIIIHDTHRSSLRTNRSAAPLRRHFTSDQGHRAIKRPGVKLQPMALSPVPRRILARQYREPSHREYQQTRAAV